MKSVQQSRVRRGAALTELAFTLPVFLMLTLGAIELGNGIHVKQSLTLAAYEAAQTVTKPGGTKAKATDQANNILNSRGIKSATIVYSPDPDTNLPLGTNVTVTIQAPISANSIGIQRFLGGTFVEAAVTMVVL